MSEQIEVWGRDRKDPDGRLIRGGLERVIDDCVVDTAGQSTINGDDVPDGNTDTLRILAPAGSNIRVGERVKVRGVDYVVQYIPFDYSYARRRPAVAYHRPRTLIIVERKEA